MKYLIVLILFITGCASVPVSESENPKKLAKKNASLALRYFIENNTQRALERSVVALKQDPESYQANYVAALIQEKLGDLEMAERYYRRAIQLKSDFSYAYDNYARMLCMQKRYSEAEQAFQKALANPKYDKPDITYVNRGLCAQQQNNIATAQQFFTQALELNPVAFSALYQMAFMAYQAGDYITARSYIERLLSLTQSLQKKPNAQALFLAYEIEVALNDFNKSLTYKDLLLRNFPNSQQAQQVLNH